MPALLIACCCHRQMHARTVNSLERLRLKCKIPYNFAILSDDALIGRARSIACSRFIELEMGEYLIFIDDDIVFEPEDIEKLYDDMVKGYDIVAGCYSVKNGAHLASSGWNLKTELNGKINDVEHLATGFMGMSRKALVDIRDKLKLPLVNPNDWSKCWPFFESGAYLKREVPIYISEDWDFCHKARDAGYRCYLDTGIQVGHVGSKVYTVMDIFQSQKFVPKDVDGYPAEDFARDSEALTQHICEFLKTDVQSINKQLSDNPGKRLGKMFEESGLSLTEFYKKPNKLLIYDLLGFNLLSEYSENKLVHLLGIKAKKVLDFGCGIGTAALFMQQRGMEVYGYDINPLLIEFCNFRKDKLGFTGIEFSTTLPDDLSDFDLVVALDVFEHIPELKETILDLGKRLKKGTKLIHLDSFTHRIPIHVDHSKEISEWLTEAGFLEFDDHKAIKI